MSNIGVLVALAQRRENPLILSQFRTLLEPPSSEEVSKRKDWQSADGHDEDQNGNVLPFDQTISRSQKAV